VASFSRSSGGERPARSALSLILDSSDGTLASPVVGSGESLRVIGDEFFSCVLHVGRDIDSKIDLLEFSNGKISHVVHGELGVLVLSIESVNIGLVGLEHSVSVLEFSVIV